MPGLHTIRISNYGLQAFSRTVGFVGKQTLVSPSRRLSTGVAEPDAMMEAVETANTWLTTEIAERLRAEAIVLVSEIRYRRLFEEAHDGTLRIGRDFSEIVHILWPQRVADPATVHFRHTLKTSELYQSPDFTETRHDTGAEQAYEWQIQRVILPAGGFGMVCFFSDITERVKIENARRQLALLTASRKPAAQSAPRSSASLRKHSPTSPAIPGPPGWPSASRTSMALLT